MSNKPKIINRGNLVYVIYSGKVVVGVGGNQWIGYNQYDNWNRQGITDFIKKIEKSKEDQYDSPSELMSLAYACSIKGSGTTKPKEIE